jgi:hypothetical protein
MDSLPAEVWGLIEEQLAMQATFSEFVTTTRTWSSSRKMSVFSVWIQQLQAGSAGLFTGTIAEVQFVRDHVHCK